jgi:myo-inositol-1(or 4)-monophosphatase
VTDTNALLELVKDVVSSSNSIICEGRNISSNYTFSSILPKEMKADIDFLIEKKIIERLQTTGIPILSEESGDIAGKSTSGLRFIIDPLDGTVNFIRQLGPATVSIALYDGITPLFGVLGIYPSNDLVWGGGKIGAFYNGNPIKVSELTNKIESVICTGIPSRLEFDKNNDYLAKLLTTYGKVRMLGSASYSLMQVARGNAEMYYEEEIMLWDVASGIALVEGAGGEVIIKKGSFNNSFNVLASNGLIPLD